LISHIAAVSKNRVIGHQGDLPWKISEDLKYFKARTLNKCIIMGRKTFDSLGKPLPNRRNVVITRDPNWSHPGVVVFNNVLEAIRDCQKQKDQYGDEIMIVGGAEIYNQTLFLAQRLYLTLIDDEVVGDAFYPEWEEEFELTEKVDRNEGGHKYSFCLFERKK
jgi:dihydrofolate reductase